MQQLKKVKNSSHTLVKPYEEHIHRYDGSRCMICHKEMCTSKKGSIGCLLLKNHEGVHKNQIYPLSWKNENQPDFDVKKFLSQWIKF